MFGPKELDLRNIYNPNLQSIQESAERTYGEANSFYRKEELYLKDVESRILSGKLSSDKDIYDECHAIASDLAKCCEMYLKALYIHEHNIPGTQIDDLWENLKNSKFKTDEKGNLIYRTASGNITFAKYDDYGNPITDVNGKIIYFDEENNTYNENNRGSKIKQNGHQLDRLIESLSPESRLLLETRMLTIPMETTEENKSVSILDVLLKKSILPQKNQISTEQYIGWIEQHKKTFEESRYSGQRKYNVNIEFLYHLATQLKAVAQYKIEPMNNQKFTVTDDELAQLPEEIKQIASFNSNLISEDLIKLIANNKEIKDKIILLFSNKNGILPKNVSPLDFYNMIKLMNNTELIYVSYLCYIIQNYDQLSEEAINENSDKIVKDLYKTAGFFKAIGVQPDKVVGLFVQIKMVFGKEILINSENIEKLFRVLNPYSDKLIKNYTYNQERFNNYEYNGHKNK